MEQTEEASKLSESTRVERMQSSALQNSEPNFRDSAHEKFDQSIPPPPPQLQTKSVPPPPPPGIILPSPNHPTQDIPPPPPPPPQAPVTRVPPPPPPKSAAASPPPPPSPGIPPQSFSQTPPQIDSSRSPQMSFGPSEASGGFSQPVNQFKQSDSGANRQPTTVSPQNSVVNSRIPDPQQQNIGSINNTPIDPNQHQTSRPALKGNPQVFQSLQDSREQMINSSGQQEFAQSNYQGQTAPIQNTQGVSPQHNPNQQPHFQQSGNPYHQGNFQQAATNSHPVHHPQGPKYPQPQPQEQTPGAQNANTQPHIQSQTPAGQPNPYTQTGQPHQPNQPQGQYFGQGQPAAAYANHQQPASYGAPPQPVPQQGQHHMTPATLGQQPAAGSATHVRPTDHPYAPVSSQQQIPAQVSPQQQAWSQPQSFHPGPVSSQQPLSQPVGNTGLPPQEQGVSDRQGRPVYPDSRQPLQQPADNGHSGYGQPKIYVNKDDTQQLAELTREYSLLRSQMGELRTQVAELKRLRSRDRTDAAPKYEQTQDNSGVEAYRVRVVPQDAQRAHEQREFEQIDERERYLGGNGRTLEPSRSYRQNYQEDIKAGRSRDRYGHDLGNSRSHLEISEYVLRENDRQGLSSTQYAEQKSRTPPRNARDLDNLEYSGSKYNNRDALNPGNPTSRYPVEKQGGSPPRSGGKSKTPSKNIENRKVVDAGGLSFSVDQDAYSPLATGALGTTGDFKGSSSNFFGHYKELRLQRYEMFHSKFRELIGELKGEMPSEAEGQEAQLKQEWRFVKELVHNLVKANKRIKELEGREEDRRKDRNLRGAY